jgi:hypothetical protein
MSRLCDIKAIFVTFCEKVTVQAGNLHNFGNGQGWKINLMKFCILAS